MSSQELLKKEFEDLQNNPNTCTGCTVGLFNKIDYFNWKVSLVGPRDTPYVGGLFFLKISFPQDYPQTSPRINFLTPIYHLNVWPRNDAKENLGLITERAFNYWKPNSPAKEILTKLYAIFYINNEQEYYLPERLSEYKQNNYLYNLKVEYFTNKYANTQNLEKGLKFGEKDWDFNVNSYYLRTIKFIWKPFEKSYIKTYDDNNTEEEINLIISINGSEEQDFKCKKRENARDVVKRFLNKIGKVLIENKEGDNIIFIFGLRKLILDKTIGQNGLKNNHKIMMISDFQNNN